MRFGFWHSPPHMLKNFSFPAFPWSLLIPKEMDVRLVFFAHVPFMLSDLGLFAYGIRALSGQKAVIDFRNTPAKTMTRSMS